MYAYILNPNFITTRYTGHFLVYRSVKVQKVDEKSSLFRLSWAKIIFKPKNKLYKSLLYVKPYLKITFKLPYIIIDLS